MSSVFVTVGTTQFDGLIKAIDSEEFACTLQEQVEYHSDAYWLTRVRPGV